MSYEVIARKYRPQIFADVVGQDHVIDTLKNAITNERVAHAYLFVGPRGTGKTSTARIFAKALCAENGPIIDFDQKKDSIVQEITAGNCMDVLEIDGASNNGVEQVRDLREGVMFMPTRARYKIYIIDEVHMLSTAAFNALLKTLEEPPAHVKFFFATTEPMKVPSTILSRCQRFDLRRISIRDIVGRLRDICKSEKIKADEEALLAIARGSEGGMRDAQSALDQLISFQGKHITEKDVLSVFGLVASGVVEELAAAVLAGDVPRIIDLIAEVDQGGKDLYRLLIDILEHFRNLLILAYSNNTRNLANLAESQIETLKEQVKGCDPDKVSRVVDILIEGEGRLRQALSKRTLLEMALIRAARATQVVTIDDLVRRLNTLQEHLGEKKK
ncbi:MAG: DNA polymerase-3 subunit gamma/tau [Kiritimatiellia bacterium]|jgi:DNA polymerase III subunit gamma/tau